MSSGLADEAFKQQDVKFIEWSQAVSAATYDLSRIADRLRHIAAAAGRPVRILDVGGGMGTVAAVLADAVPAATVDVVDSSPLARQHFARHERVRLVYADYFAAELAGPYEAILFRTVLHHFVARSAGKTRQMQGAALDKARSLLRPGGRLFVTENFYEAAVGTDAAGALIFALTSLRSLAGLMRRLGANTAGEGVRFRSLAAWKRMFAAHGLVEDGPLLKQPWTMPAWQRWPLLCRERYQGLLELCAVDQPAHRAGVPPIDGAAAHP